MNRVFVTGDTHGDFRRFTSSNWKTGKELDKDDYVIITGDFGGIWDVNKSGKEELHWLNWLNDKPWTTLFIDGNHECVSKDTEVLTKNGWVNIVDAYSYKELKIANFDINNKKINFDYPLNRIKSYKDECVEIRGDNIHQNISLDHDLIIDKKKVKAIDIVNDKLKEDRFLTTGISGNDDGADISDNYIKLLTWVIMDGTIIDYSKYNKNSKKITIQFKLSKERKIKALILLLNNMDINHTFKKATRSKNNKLQPYYIRIYGDYSRDIFERLNYCKKIPFYWRNFNRKQVEIFLDTLRITDGHKVGENGRIVWRSTNSNNVDIAQEFCIKNGINFTNKKYENGSGFKKEGQIQYINQIHPNKNMNRYVKIKIIPYNDYMYCFTMPKGTLITRLNGKVVLTGNCHDRLDTLPLVDMFGSQVGKVNDSVFHLRRGEIYNIAGRSIFTFGGGFSIDKARRTEFISWWSQELPNNEEYKKGLKSLQEVDNKVDFIITHSAPEIMFKKLRQVFWMDEKTVGEEQLREYFDILITTINYKGWYCGHFHQNWTADKFNFLYFDIKELD